ncbi:MAG: hypothetical protein F2799_07810 [Actinobacteria bacterium]|uniref:Unannotated protein n=1 Tax=freshwater metagenome TaxID=449393 RepID=A0A6J7ES78_9ZZZZ|nr:hypothetical protein [Actinomycetota bacterium]
MASRNLKKISAVLAVVALTASPAMALADPGGDQYCDPFGGCGVDPGAGGGGTKGHGKKHPTAPNQAVLNAIAGAMQAQSLSAAERAAMASGADAAAVAAWHKASKLARAGVVLDAAGLSAVRSSLPSS